MVRLEPFSISTSRTTWWPGRRARSCLRFVPARSCVVTRETTFDLRTSSILALTDWFTRTVTTALRPARRTLNRLTRVLRTAFSVTVIAPFIIVACGSHTYLYVPAARVTFHRCVPT